MNPRHDYIRVYVWEVPVRLFHWLNALCILVLCATGFLIGHPLSFMAPGEAAFGYWFGTIRFVHFLTAYVFVAVLVLRLYWAFAGNKFANWRNFIPMTRRQVKDSVKTAKVEILQVSNEPMDFLGHNPVAYFSYTGTFLLALFEIVSGFALYAPRSGSWFPQLFTWVTPLFGGEYQLRTFHHAVMWLFAAFVMIHVYLAMYQEAVVGDGALSSIVGGWKFMERRKAEAPQAHGMSPYPTRKSRP